jgi:hypothetical protein
MAAGTSRARAAIRTSGDVEAFVGTHVEPGGQQPDDGEAEGSQRGQPRQDARRHGQDQAGGAEDLREASEDHLRTGQLGEPGPSLYAAAKDLRGAGREEEEGKEPMNRAMDQICAGYSDDQLDLLAEFLGRTTTVGRDATDELRGPPGMGT